MAPGAQDLCRLKRREARGDRCRRRDGRDNAASNLHSSQSVDLWQVKRVSSAIRGPFDPRRRSRIVLIEGDRHNRGGYARRIDIRSLAPPL
jgi:hypothetical protein